MKTEQLSGNNSDPIWASNVELLPPEECLPVIGSCQVSSILQNLDTTTDHNLHSMDLIILNGNEYKMPLEAPLNLHANNYIVLKDPVSILENRNNDVNSDITETNVNIRKNGSDKYAGTNGDNNGQKIHIILNEKLYDESRNLKPTDLSLNVSDISDSINNSPTSPKHYDKESFEDMLYFVCNLCPFLCTKEEKITEHLRSAHKNKTISKLVQLKCPACTNIFYHSASLKSHLLHDHCVASSDLNLIVQAVLYYSIKENKKESPAKSADDSPRSTVERPLLADRKKSESASPIPDSGCFELTPIGCKAVEDLQAMSRIEVKDALDLVKSPQKISVPVATASLDPTSQPSDFDIHDSEENQQCVVTSQKVALPQVDITTNKSEKLITDLMKKTSTPPLLLADVNSQKCAFPNCRLSLSNAKKMEYHMECHFNDGFRCLECQEKFLLWKSLISHLWRMHKIDMELYSCDKCDYKTNSLSKLNKIHKLIHSSVKAFKCENCHKSFKNKKQLRNHQRIHRNVQKEVLTCEMCSKTFTDKRRLRAHMDTVHKKLKPYLCNYCGYKGSCRASLKMHVRSHTGEKPFSCDQCQYSSSDHNSLRRHKLRHTGQKPYKCSYCSYACIQSSTYKVHLKTKHPGMEKDLMFTCFLCQYRTVNRDMYKSHIFVEHNLKPPVHSD